MNFQCHVKNFVMDTGERYCLLVDKSSNLPLYFPNLFITTQVRNKSLSLSAMNAALNGIKVLIGYLETKNDNLVNRFLAKKFFDSNELDAIRDYCQKKFSTHSPESTVTSLKKRKYSEEKVSKETEYNRLTVISQYLEWLSLTLLTENIDKNTRLRIGKMTKGLKARRPPRKRRNTVNDDKGLTEDQIELIFELFRPESEFNPFKDEVVKKRNRLVFLLLYHLGLRGGELLNIRIRDIDFQNSQIVVVRRADEQDDMRKNQPLVKTLDRRLPLKETMIKKIHDYILNERKSVPNADKHDFLFVTHKSGPTVGQPLSKSGYKKIIEVVRNTAPGLYKLTGHQLRHTWNENFSRLMDQMDKPPSHEKQEKLRSYLMGWKEGSGTSSVYNQRFINEKAQESALELQKGAIRLPKGMKDDK